MRYLYLILITHFTLFSAAQRIKNFNLSLSNSTVKLSFVLSAGVTSNGYNVLRSLDSAFYNVVYSVSDPCGSFSNDMSYSATDGSPGMYQVNYYKIQLSSGETSEAKRIYVSNASSASMIVFPNPVTNVNDPVNLKLFNTNNISVSGYLYNEYGLVLQSLNLFTNGEITSINGSLLRNGIYLIWLTDGAARYSCKFVVLQ